MRDELWIKHDARSRNDGKMRWFIKRTGMVGYGAFWATIEVLHYQNDHSIPIQGPEFIGIAEDIGLTPDDYFNLVKVAAEAGLFTIENGKLWQERLKRDQAKRSEAQAASKSWMKELGKRGGIASAAKRRNSQAIDTNEESEAGSSEAQAGSTLERRERRERIYISNTKVLDNKKGSKQPVQPSLQVEFPAKWGDRSKEAFKKWVDYRKEIRKPLKPKSLQAQVNHFADNPRLFASLVERTIHMGWQGLNEQIPFNAEQQIKTSKQAETLNAVKEILEEAENDITAN